MNLELAKMFIDQLGMIQEKTQGNLTNEESTVLRNTLSNLQMAFVEVSRNVKSGGGPATPEPAAPTAEQPTETAPAEKTDAPEAPATESESRKKFTKSYGA